MAHWNPEHILNLLSFQLTLTSTAAPIQAWLGAEQNGLLFRQELQRVASLRTREEASESLLDWLKQQQTQIGSAFQIEHLWGFLSPLLLRDEQELPSHDDLMALQEPMTSSVEGLLDDEDAPAPLPSFAHAADLMMPDGEAQAAKGGAFQWGEGAKQYNAWEGLLGDASDEVMAPVVPPSMSLFDEIAPTDGLSMLAAATSSALFDDDDEQAPAPPTPTFGPPTTNAAPLAPAAPPASMSPPTPAAPSLFAPPSAQLSVPPSFDLTPDASVPKAPSKASPFVPPDASALAPPKKATLAPPSKAASAAPKAAPAASKAAPVAPKAAPPKTVPVPPAPFASSAPPFTPSPAPSASFTPSPVTRRSSPLQSLTTPVANVPSAKETQNVPLVRYQSDFSAAFGVPEDTATGDAIAVVGKEITGPAKPPAAKPSVPAVKPPFATPPPKPVAPTFSPSLAVPQQETSSTKAALDVEPIDDALSVAPALGSHTQSELDAAFGMAFASDEESPLGDPVESLVATPEAPSPAVSLVAPSPAQPPAPPAARPPAQPVPQSGGKGASPVSAVTPLAPAVALSPVVIDTPELHPLTPSSMDLDVVVGAPMIEEKIPAPETSAPVVPVASPLVPPKSAPLMLNKKVGIDRRLANHTPGYIQGPASSMPAHRDERLDTPDVRRVPMPMLRMEDAGTLPLSEGLAAAFDKTPSSSSQFLRIGLILLGALLLAGGALALYLHFR